MVIAKIIQNLANNIFFGKEAYMVVMNKFLGENIVNVTRFLSELNVCSLQEITRSLFDGFLQKYTPTGSDEEHEEWIGTAYDDTETIVLHRFFEKHVDKVGKELMSKPLDEGDAYAIDGRRTWETLCSTLVDMGQPMDIPRLSMLSSSQQRDYLDLMSRYNHRSTTSVRDIFIETFTEKVRYENLPIHGAISANLVPFYKDIPAVFVLFVSKIDVETLDIELLLYHIFKVHKRFFF